MESKDEALRKLLEFYFSDSNLSKDSFLREKINGNPERWVSFEILQTFNKWGIGQYDPIE